MPIRDIKVKGADGKYILDENGNYVVECEKFGAYFIADSKEDADRLIKEFDTDISMLATKRHMVTGVDEQDLKQEGLIGLARASRDFEEGRSGDFRIFAIYKIKDAMREFITTQASNIRIPQYIRDATNLIESLKKIMEKVTDIRYMSYNEVWNLAKEIQIESAEIKKNILMIMDSLNNLAARSHSSVPQLLERSEIMPKLTVDVENFIPTDMSDILEEEKDMVELISNRKYVEDIKTILEPLEFELLWNLYVEDYTERELEPMLGIKAPTIDVRAKNILKKLERYKNKVLQNEINTTVEEVEQGQLC